MRTIPAACLTVILLASAAMADQFLIAGQTREGRFRAFSGGRFELSTDRRTTKEPASRVTKLTVSEPLEVNYTTSDGKQHKGAQFKGYAMGIFRLATKEGGDVSVPQIKLRSLEVVFHENAAPAEGGGEARDPAPALDLSAIDRSGLTGAQVSAMENYLAARAAYDAYVALSSQMVNQMNGLKGPQREAVLNQLRQRKAEEQPIRNRLTSACTALKTAIPGL
jgi:hypothetical protein